MQKLQILGYSTLGIWLGVAWGVSLGIGWGVVWGIAWSVFLIFSFLSFLFLGLSKEALILAGTFLCRIVWVLASGVASGVALDVTAGVALGVVSGLPSNSIWVFAIAIFFLLIPIFLWLIELLWITFVYVL